MAEPQGRSSLSAFRQRASALGEITGYEADGDGRVYAVYANGEVLPIGIKLPSLASKSNITHAAFADAVYEATSDV